MNLMIKKALDNCLPLKELICGEDHLDFEFSEEFMDSKADHMQQWARQIIRCERDENIHFNSFWNTLRSNFEYFLGEPSDERMPMRDADRV